MAQVLKETGLRTWSGPFDWVFSSPAMVRHCLADDFATLLDPAEYRPTQLHERPAPDACLCSHRAYARDFGIVAVFNHHDPASRSADHRFLQEGVRRLRAALARADADNRFYLLASRPTSDAAILDLAEELARHGPSHHLHVIQMVEGFAPEAGDVPVVKRVAHGRANLTWLRLATASPSTGIRFADPSDDRRLRRLVLALAAGDDLAKWHVN